MKKQKIMIIAVIVALVVAVGYIIIDQYNEKQQQKITEAYQQGIQIGYEQAVVQLIQEAVTCQPVPVRYKNQTINVFAVECLQQEVVE
jgi:predicted negative regulator of RcsB-dependent stress response